MNMSLTEVLGIRYPILQGAMAWISDSNLAAAVSEAGAGGVIGAGGRDADWVREEIRKTKNLTDKPFGINVSLESTPWRESLIDCICTEGVGFVTLGAGNPIPHIERFREAGIRIVGIIPNLRLAKRVEAAGIDAIVIEGMEAGGRIGTQTTMSLMTNILPAIKIPVLAAGGIVDGRGMAAALVMGAAGVQMGSRFLLSDECVVHPSYKEAIIRATDEDSVTTGLSRGMGMRGLRSNFSDRYHQMETNGAPIEELNAFATGSSRRVAEEGLGADGMNGIVQVGQGLTPLREILPVKKIIQDIIQEANVCLSAAAGKKIME